MPSPHKLRESLSLLWLFFNPIKTRPQAIYNVLATHNNLGNKSLYLNLGYWKNAKTYDDACEALAAHVGEKANFKPTDKVLDVGFGFGDQDLLWLRKFNPAHITGINITSMQVEAARKRMAQEPEASRLQFEEASATAIPHAEGTFDKVISLEAAFHFVTREDFLWEAFRVLKPGGKLILADCLPSLTPPKRKFISRWFVSYVGRSFWQFPKENYYPVDELVSKLIGTGFHVNDVEDISEHVFSPFARYVKDRVNEPEIVAKVNPLIRKMWAANVAMAENPSRRDLDYVVLVATKPALPAKKS